jgi:hypothetical protein
MMQRLVHSDQGPEPGMLILLRHAEVGGDVALGPVHRDVDGKIDQSDKPEPRSDDEDERDCN